MRGITGIPEDEPIKWKLTFRSGGVTTFLKIYFDLMTMARSIRSAMGDQAAQIQAQDRFYKEVADAYTDPNDPSVVYLTEDCNEFLARRRAK